MSMTAQRASRQGTVILHALFLLLLQPLLCAAVLAQYVPASERQSILQTPALPRLAEAVLDVRAPSERIQGLPGSMRIIDRSCRAAPLPEVRRRIVNTAVQEWAWFGFQIDDLRSDTADTTGNTRPRRFLPLNPEEVARVAATVGGYWSAAPGSDWILQRQNDVWKRADGLSSRWRDPWSAAFISWVMCESGLGDTAQFQRAIAHHTYIDQAIVASDNKIVASAFRAWQPGETEISPGDLLCSGLRPMYQTLQERRSQLGIGARTHCDIVVSVNAEAGHILTIGGNVRASVRMKILAAGKTAAAPNLAPLPTRRPIFAHLQLQSAALEAEALDNTPTLQQLACTLALMPVTFATAAIELPANHDCGQER